MRIRWGEFDTIFREFTDHAAGAASFYLEDDAGSVVAGDASAEPAIARHRLTMGGRSVAKLYVCGKPSPETVRLCWAACERELAHQMTVGDMADATARLWRQTNALLRMSESTSLALEPAAMLGRVLGVLAHATQLERGCALVRVAGDTDFTLFGYEHPRKVPPSAVAALETLLDDVTMLTGEGDAPLSLSAECAALLGRGGPSVVARIATENARYGYLLVPYKAGATVSSEDLKVLGAATRIVGIAIENSHTLLREREATRLHVENEMLTGQAREMEEMLHVVSHDLRSPMTAIYGFMHIALDELEDLRTAADEGNEAEIDEFSGRIAQPLEEGIRSVERLNGMVQRLLDFSRVARLEYEFEPLDMESLVRGVVESLSFQLRERGIAITVAKLPNTVGDRVQVEAVFRNLIDNAVKYMGDGPKRTIEVGSRNEDGGVVYFVRDTGMGMNAEQCSKAFLPFRRFRVDAAPGEGIGLSYVRKIVERHGGRIWCESIEGEGTVFSFTLRVGG